MTGKGPGMTTKQPAMTKNASTLCSPGNGLPKGATLVNTARKEVIDEQGVMRALTEREDLKYVTDIAAAVQPEFDEKFGKRVFATAKKMGAETAEANLNAGLAAARQIVGFFTDGCTRFQVNKG